jgi:hypothetical protein
MVLREVQLRRQQLKPVGVWAMKPLAVRVSISIFSLLLIASQPDIARAEPRLNPTLAPFQFMVGSWQCRSWIAQSGRVAPRVAAINTKYSVMGGGRTLGQHVSGPDYRSFELFGYEASSKRIVTSAYADDGTRVVASSAGWAGNAIVLSGTLQSGGSEADLRDIMVRFTDRRFTDTTEIRQSGRWKTVADSDCNKR